MRWSTATSTAPNGRSHPRAASPTRARPGHRPRRGGDVRRRETPDLEAKLDGQQKTPRLGTVPDREDGRRGARDRRRGRAHPRARRAPGRRRRWPRMNSRCSRRARRRGRHRADAATSTRRPRARWTRRTRRPTAYGPARSSSTSRATDYINSSGIAVIVGLLAKARATTSRSGRADCRSTTARSSRSPGCRTS